MLLGTALPTSERKVVARHPVSGLRLADQASQQASKLSFFGGVVDKDATWTTFVGSLDFGT